MTKSYVRDLGGTPRIRDLPDVPVANADLADMAQATVKGRASGAGTGPPTDLTASQLKAILGVTEAGTWTPGVSFGGGTTGITYTTQVGRYTKIGNLVWVQGLITLSSKGSSTGAARLTGLPVASSSVSNNFAGGSVVFGGMATAGPYLYQVNPSSSVAEILKLSVATTAAAQETDFANTSVIVIGLMYMVD